MTEIRVGTCSWADQSLVKHWYPRGVSSSEARLRHYAEHFDAVEVDSTFYRLPEEENAVKWAERTPDGFVFHVKAFGVMTRHPVRLEQLPPELREGVPTDEKGWVDRPPREFRGRDLQALPRPARAAQSSRKARRDPAPVPLLRRLSRPLVRLPPLGAGATRRPRRAGRVSPPELVRGREPGRDAQPPRRTRREQRDRRRAEDRREEPDSDRTGAHEPASTYASTAGTRRRGTSAARAPPSGSTTSTPTRSWPSGKGHFGS